MLTVVCWKWKPNPGYRSTFTSEHVLILRNMVRRHYRDPHEFVCVTDDAAGLDDGVRVVPLWDDHARVRNPHGTAQPSCYRRLRAFAPDAATFLGKRFVSVDLDCVITGDVTPLWNRPEDFVIWGDTNPTTPYNGSMWLLRAGARPRVWTDFDPVRSPKLALQKGYFGSDQAWIGACLGPGEPTWTTRDGVYSYRNHLRLNKGPFPANARIVMFHGRHDPWHVDVQNKHAWVRENWR